MGVAGTPVTRLHILPLFALPEGYDGEMDRLPVISAALVRLRESQQVISRGQIVESELGFPFVVVRCMPGSGGVITKATEYFCSGPVVPRLRRLQVTALLQRTPEHTEQDLFSNH